LQENGLKKKTPPIFRNGFRYAKPSPLIWADHRCRKAIFELAQPFKAENYAD
jgi:hypothetical protein